MPTVYDEPGRARRPCPNCDKYIHVRAKGCIACGFVLKSSMPNKNQTQEPQSKNVVKTYSAKTWTEDGQGRKRCPECKIYCGARCHNCPACDFTFEKGVSYGKPKTTSVQGEFEAVSENLLNHIENIKYEEIECIAPSGECPATLENLSDTAVKKWLAAIKEAGIKANNSLYYLRVPKYWARGIFQGEEDGAAKEKKLLKKIEKLAPSLWPVKPTPKILYHHGSSFLPGRRMD